MNKKVLIVCYSFPPNPGVGGRKWAKKSKYFLKNGWEVHVLLKKPLAGDISPWTSDTHGCILHFLDPCYPDILNKNPKNIFEKIKYRIALIFTRLISLGNYYDRAVFLRRELLKKVNEIISKNSISNLVVSGAPFNLLYYGSLLKKQKQKEILYLADIRDSWLSDNYFGYGLLSGKRKIREKHKLINVLNIADYTIVPNEIMLNDYSQLAVNPEKLLIYPHACDSDLMFERNNNHSETIRLVCFGSHYHDLSDVFRDLAAVLKKSPKINIEFYTTDFKYRHLFEIEGKLINNVYYNNLVEEKEVFRILSSATAAILFTPNFIKDYISTKYMENVAARIPMLLIGKEGKASNFVVQNNLGVFISDQKVIEKLQSLKQTLSDLYYNDKFDISPYLFENQVKQLEKLLISHDGN